MDTNVWVRRVNDYVIPATLSRGSLQLRWDDVIIKDLKDHNMQNWLTRVEWRRTIMPRKIQLQRVRPIRCEQAL